MRNPSDLKIFGQAHELVLEVYALTAQFPSDERFGLTQQIRRAAVSIPSNIAEGCSRESQADFRRFIEIATGSAMELRYQLFLAQELDYGLAVWEKFPVREKTETLVRALIAFSKTLRA